MAQQPKYYLVEATALPEIFLKVAEAKRMLQTGEVSTVHDAAKMMDISRSAFYKYRDSIFPFQNMMAGRIITFQMILRECRACCRRYLPFLPNAAQIYLPSTRRFRPTTAPA